MINIINALIGVRQDTLILIICLLFNKSDIVFVCFVCQFHIREWGRRPVGARAPTLL